MPEMLQPFQIEVDLSSVRAWTSGPGSLPTGVYMATVTDAGE